MTNEHICMKLQLQILIDLVQFLRVYNIKKQFTIQILNFELYENVLVNYFK